MKFYSIRVVEAESWDEAQEKVENGEFLEDDEMCDQIMTAEELDNTFFS